METVPSSHLHSPNGAPLCGRLDNLCQFEDQPFSSLNFRKIGHSPLIVFQKTVKRQAIMGFMVDHPVPPSSKLYECIPDETSFSEFTSQDEV